MFQAFIMNLNPNLVPIPIIYIVLYNPRTVIRTLPPTRNLYSVPWNYPLCSTLLCHNHNLHSAHESPWNQSMPIIRPHWNKIATMIFKWDWFFFLNWQTKVVSMLQFRSAYNNCTLISIIICHQLVATPSLSIVSFSIFLALIEYFIS